MTILRPLLRAKALPGLPGLFALLLVLPLASRAADPDFQKDVRPILSRYCFKCHGPDDSARKAKFRLDVRDNALSPAKSGALPIVPGKPDKSELVKRIFSKDEDEVMPPASTKNPLSAEQREILKRWIGAGAKYQPHWAFVPPKQSPLPKVKQSDWPRNPIDRFVLARLEAARLKPAPQADRYALVRRVYLDLIGLPPTPEEVDEFINDKSATAYEKLVDRLLQSEHYGERWARRWLDLARYADTNGYEKDRQRSIWPYRDWVIKALNADLPFDRFTIEQIAGDLLPTPTRDQLIATGFNRNTMLNEEGGIDPLEFRFNAMTDRVGTAGRVWLGLTVQCAQCHTHKFDPITQREYYQIFAFLNNADEPELDLPGDDAAAKEKSRQEQIEKLLAELPDKWPMDEAKAKQANATDERPLEVRRREAVAGKFAEWLQSERDHTVKWVPLRPMAAKSNLPLLTVQPDDSVFVSGDITKSDTYELKFRPDLRGITAVRLEVLPDDRLPAHGPGLTFYEGPKGDFFMGEFQMSADGQPVKFGKATASYAKNNFGGVASAALAIDGDPQTGWSCAGRPGERHEAVFNLATPLEDARELDLKMMFGRHYACSLGRFRISVTTDSREARAHEMTDETALLLTLADEQLTSDQRGQLWRRFLLTAPELAKARAPLDLLRKPVVHTTTLVMRERPPENPRPTFIHRRGEYLQPTDPVNPGVLAVLNPLPAGAPANRLGLAEWLVSPANPLMARVTVNRQWAAFFGHGIVRTVEDFGYQGEPPSHPELLDWLAVEFMKKGWSLKQLHRLIVLSATYQQSSRVTSELLAKDAENRLFSRGPRVRLEAELIRDSVLRLAGLLTDKIGGPSVYPPQPPGVTTEGTYGAMEWKVSQGADRYRRGLYTFSKRTAPYAMFTTFDGPSGEACIAQREVSNTPLQALTMLNDPVMIEAAQALGRTLAEREGGTTQRVEYLFRLCFARPAAPDEAAAAVKFLDEQRQKFSSGQLAAAKIAGEGRGDINERAAWIALVRALFNLDEAITKG